MIGHMMIVHDSTFYAYNGRVDTKVAGSNLSINMFSP